jgi:catechol-2,3-dioxygenase
MAYGVRLGVAVMFVRNLDRSVPFYRKVLGLEVIDRSTTAVLLGNGAGAQLVLRASGENAAHPLGGIGLQYVLWTVDSKEELDRCTQELRQLSAYRETRATQDAIAVEGHDPDDLVLLLAFTGEGQGLLRELPARIYAW